MSDPAAVKTLEDRDLAKYGDPDGPETFEGAVAELTSNERMTEQQAYEHIVGSARRSNKEYDRRHGIKKAKP